MNGNIAVNRRTFICMAMNCKDYICRLCRIPRVALDFNAACWCYHSLTQRSSEVLCLPNEITLIAGLRKFG